MTEEQFEQVMAQVMAKLDEGPGSHTDVLKQLAERHTAVKELQELVDGMNESLQFVRLVLKYMLFDLEATRRERDELKTILEDQDQ